MTSNRIGGVDIFELERFKVNWADVGIYALLKGDSVVYIGKSENITNRIKDHVKAREKDFDSYSVIACKHDELDDLEMFMIFKYKPRYNKQMTGFCKLETLVDKIREILPMQSTKKEVRSAIGGMELNSYDLDGVKMYRSSSRDSVARYMIHETLSREAIKNRLGSQSESA